MQKALNSMGMTGPGPAPGMANGMMQNGAQQGQTSLMPISPQQQMEFMAMMEQQARMMAQFMPGMMQQQAVNPAFPQNGTYNYSGTIGALTYWALDAIKNQYLKAPGPLVHT